jgi:hypothetical protein
MQFRVVIPDKCKPGQTIRIHCPDGTEANIKIPKGVKPGDSFIFELAADQLQNPKALLDSIKQKNGAVQLAATTDGTGDGSRQKVPSSTSAQDKVAAAHSTFWDREIVNCQDFFFALSVGLVIGLAIILGFLMGILYVTRDFPAPEYE